MKPTTLCPRVRHVALAAGLLCCGISAHAASIQGIGVAPGGTWSAISGLSSNGSAASVQGDRTGSAGGSDAMRWTSGSGFVTQGNTAGTGYSSTSTAISADGQTVTGYFYEPGYPATGFVNNTGSGRSVLSSLGGTTQTWDISADGTKVAGSSDNQAVLWTNGSAQILGTFGGLYSGAFGISSDGSTVVGWAYDSLFTAHAFRWTTGSGLVALDNGSTSSRAYAASSDGQLVVGSVNSPVMFSTDTSAVLWTLGGGSTNLGDLPGGATSAEATGISGDGGVIIGHSKSASGDEGFVWTAGTGMVSVTDYLGTNQGIDLTGWVLAGITAVSLDGQHLAGNGTYNGVYQGWVATLNSTAPVPEPGESLLLAAGLSMLGLRGRRSGRRAG